MIRKNINTCVFKVFSRFANSGDVKVDINGISATTSNTGNAGNHLYRHGVISIFTRMIFAVVFALSLFVSGVIFGVNVPVKQLQYEKSRSDDNQKAATGDSAELPKGSSEYGHWLSFSVNIK